MHEDGDEPLRSLILVVLFACCALLPILGDIPVRDPDVWWHLATGRWILAHHAIPTVDPFASGGVAQPWVAYSWLFDVAIYGLYQWLGLGGLMLYSVVTSLALTGVVYVLLQRIERRFVVAVVLTALVCVATWRHLGARTFLLTIIAFCLELDLLWTARRTGAYPRLLWLIPLFAVWANVHIQFVYGLAALALAALEAVVEQARGSEPQGLDGGGGRRAAWLIGVLAASALATLLNPYGWRVYGVVYEYAVQTAPWVYLRELRAPTFRSPLDWIVLGLLLGGAYVLGRRRLRLFPVSLLAMAAVLSLRAVRDSWLGALVGAVLLADGGARAIAPMPSLPTVRRWPTRAMAVVAILALAWAAKAYSSRGGLEAVVAETFPEAAVTRVAAAGLHGPLYNHMNWGGYLLWRLPDMPVAIDGRTNVQGDAVMEASMRTWAALPGWRDDPRLSAAGVVIAPAGEPLTAMLREDTRFRVFYEDHLAVVFASTLPPAAGAPSRSSCFSNSTHGSGRSTAGVNHTKS